jgi:hypothetical protein
VESIYEQWIKNVVEGYQNGAMKKRIRTGEKRSRL